MTIQDMITMKTKMRITNKEDNKNLKGEIIMTLEINLLKDMKIERTWKNNRITSIRKYKLENDEWILVEEHIYK